MNTLHPTYFLYTFVQPGQLLTTTVSFLLLIVGMLTYTLTYLLKRRKRSENRKLLQNNFYELISLLAISENEIELKELLSRAVNKENMPSIVSDPFSRHILIKELVTAAKNMNGIALRNICWFYNELGPLLRSKIKKVE